MIETLYAKALILLLAVALGVVVIGMVLAPFLLDILTKKDD